MANGTMVVDRGPHPSVAEVVSPVLSASGGARFDWLMAGFGSWLIGGLYLDGWAHIHVPALETFFTPWHAVLYSGYIAGAVALAVTLRLNRRRGASRWDALPAGYGLSLAGAFIFFFGGLADMLWHVVFGIEEGVEGLISPSHLVLALGGSLMITGPLRAGLAHPAVPLHFAPAAGRGAVDGEHRRAAALPLPTAVARRLHGARVGAAGAVGAARRPRAAAAPAVARVSRAARPARRMEIDDRPAARARRRARGRRRALSETVAVGAAPPPGVRDRGPGVRPLRGPAADPGRGDRPPRRAPRARRPRPGREAAAGAARPRRLTRARSRPSPGAAVPSVRRAGGGFRPSRADPRRPCRPDGATLWFQRRPRGRWPRGGQG